MAPDPSYYWEGGREGERDRESNARTINGMKKKQQQKERSSGRLMLIEQKSVVLFPRPVPRALPRCASICSDAMTHQAL